MRKELKIIVVGLLVVSFFVLFLNTKKPSLTGSTSLDFSGDWSMYYIDRITKESKGADGTDLFDVNNDANLDIVTGWEESGDVRIYINPGNKNSWQAKQVCETCSGSEDAHFVDIDNDSIVEVVSTSGKVFNIMTARDRNLNSWDVYDFSAPRARWMVSDSGNIDDKNSIDVVAGSKKEYSENKPPGGIFWFESPVNPKNILSWKVYKIADSDWIMGLVLADMDKDNDLDVLVSDRPDKVSWFENSNDTRTKNWREHIIGKTCSGRWMIFEDLDDDGIKDVVVADSCKGSAVTWFKGENKKDNWQSYKIGILSGSKISASASKSVDVGDINKDGKKDIVIATYAGGSGVYWLSYNNSVHETKWKASPIYTKGGTKFDEVHLVDVDKDNDLDIITSDEYKLGVVWFENPLSQQVTCDNDRDGFNSTNCGGRDCNDNNPEINPEAIEVCNNVDDNCNQGVDENLNRNCGEGLCSGNQTCNLGVWQACSSYGRNCSDNLFCDGEETCDSEGDCSGTEIDCSYLDEQCSLGVCDEANKLCKKEARVNAGCNDNNLCTINDMCKEGKCSGTLISCNDNFKCTNDFCLNGFCQYVFNSSIQNCSCQNNNECNDNNYCTNDACINNACVYNFNSLPCNDNNLCTINDSCYQGECRGITKNCNDNLECTRDSCYQGNCVYDNSNCDCENNNDCNDNNICTDNFCNLAAKLCYRTYNNLTCNDTDKNTINDKCVAGRCLGESICNANRICESARGENCENCAYDCGFCLTPAKEEEKKTTETKEKEEEIEERRTENLGPSNAPVLPVISEKKFTASFWIALGLIALLLIIILVVLISTIVHLKKK